MSALQLKQGAANADFWFAWREDGRKPTRRQVEEAGEDVGYFQPVSQPSTAESFGPNAVEIREGFTGELCDHSWDRRMHFSRNPYGYIYECGKCGLRARESYRVRAHTGTYLYDVWELREHIWRRWMQRGPVPGALIVEPHHKAGDTRE